MTTYVPIPNGDIDQDSPITQPLVTALRDNPIAITEEASGAPKIMRKAKAASGATSTFSNLGDYGGFILHGSFFAGTGAGTHDLTFEVSDDGTTYYGTVTLFSAIPSSSTRNFYLALDFATGSYIFTGGTNYTNAFSTSGTISGASTAITHVRFAVVGTASTGFYFMEPNGGLV